MVRSYAEDKYGPSECVCSVVRADGEIFVGSKRSLFRKRGRWRGRNSVNDETSSGVEILEWRIF